MLLKNVIPELNLWFGNILVNNDINIVHVDFPVLLTQKWRCRDSVIDILFNECSDPSGALYDGHPYITRFKTINLNRLYPYDATLYRRVQTIINRCYVFAADDPNNEELQAAFNKVTPSFVIDSTNDGDTIAQAAGVTPTKYVTKYDSCIVTTGSDQLHCELPDKDYDGDDSSEPSAYTPGEDIFMFTDEELELIDYLYYYRTEQYELIPKFEDGYYEKLVSPLSKWIYLYLQCYVYNIVNWEYLDSKCTIEHDGILRTMFEKHAQDRIYQYIQKQNYIIWNEIQDLGDNQLRRIFVDYTMPCLTNLSKGRISDIHLSMGKIVLDFPENKQPQDSKTFEFIYDGIILKLGKDYDVINEGTLKDTQACVILKNPSKFNSNTKYQLMWNCLTPSSPYSRVKGFKKKHG